MKKLIVRVVPPMVRRRIKSQVLPPLLRSARFIVGRAPKSPVNLKRFSVPSKETFIGYYEVDPYSADGEAILAHTTTTAACVAKAGSEATIGYFERDSGRFVAVGSTDLWCWQMGSRLRWWPGEARGLAYNARIDGEAGCWLSRPGAKPELIASLPLFDVDTSGRIGLAINFGRLAWARPGYGYPVLDDPYLNVPLPQDDGISIVDLSSGTVRLVAPMPSIAELSGPHPENTYHYLNAATLSPRGRRFSVLHISMDNPKRSDMWKAVAVIGATEGGGLQLVPLPGTPSHYWWIDDEMIVYTINPRAAGASSCYYRYSVVDRKLKPVHDAAPAVDGHPSLHAESSRWITDRYPDLFGEQALYTLEPDGRRQELAILRQHHRYMGEWRCDLHPRWAREGDRVAIDSTHEGFRAIYEVAATPPG